MTADERARLAEIEAAILARRPEHTIDPTLDRISALVDLLGDPHQAYPVIHLTGTNGKTSTARMTERLLRARGLRTGLFTSPHLSSFRERICIDGEPLSPEEFIAAYDEIEPYLGLVDDSQPGRLSFFEVLVGMAFATFADAPVDVAVIEVGLGGTWDNTNIADGAVAVLTPIAIDHVRWLGSTVEEIAAEKSGIIKPGAVAVIAQQSPAAAEVLLRRAAEVGATVAREGLEFGVLSRELAVGGQRVSVRGLLGDYEDLFLPLFGAYQAGNLACAVAAVEAFARPAPTGTPSSINDSVDGIPPAAPIPSGAGPSLHLVGADSYGDEPDGEGLNGHEPDGHEPDGGGAAGPLDIGLVREATATMTSPGRLEVVRRSPLVVIDAAHNPAGMAATVAAVEESFQYDDLIVIAAISADKDVAGILDELEPAATRLIATSNVSGRAMEPDDLADAAQAVLGPDRVSVAARLDEAIELAVGLADEADAAGGGTGTALVLITGSVYTAGEARVLLTQGGMAASASGPQAGWTIAGDVS
jgi:folylpolyglutamate synthase/dihydropteroate synthase